MNKWLHVKQSLYHMDFNNFWKYMVILFLYYWITFKMIELNLDLIQLLIGSEITCYILNW
jgi:hypothetical protein